MKFAIKVDFLNSRVEFSPNAKIILKPGSDSDKPIFILEYNASTQPNKYSSFNLSNMEIGADEVYDEEDRFWKGLIDINEKATLSSSPKSAANAPIPSLSNTPIPTVPKATPPPSVPSHSSIPSPSPVTSVTPVSVSQPSSVPIPSPHVNPDEANKLLAQWDSMKRMIANLDGQFAAGNIAQDQYLEKKNFLAQKMGVMMGELDAKGIKYEF
jgi:hypothetical protein